jgi:HSP90 family molecular chaperone
VIEVPKSGQSTFSVEYLQAELKQEDYDEFYKSLTFDFEAPLTQLHNRVEGNLDYTSLLYPRLCCLVESL